MKDASYNVTTADYRDHRPLALSGMNLWENNGWIVWARVEGEEFLGWFSPYRLVGRQVGSLYSVDDVSLSQTLVLKGTFEGERRRRMEDDPYLCVGFDLGDHLPGEALQVAVEDGGSVWRTGKRKFTATPPRWKIEGMHAGVDVDLTLDAMAPAFWFTDRSRTVEEIEERWHLVCARARGTVNIGGRTHAIDGFACHERHVHCGTRYNPIQTLSARGVTWHSAGVDNAQVLLFSRPSLGIFWGKVVIDGVVHEFDSPSHQCEIAETDFWVDPASRVQIPCAWESRFEGPSGSLSVSARAFSRAYYLWPNYQHGCTILYWWIGEADIRCRLKDGRELSWDKVQYIVHDNRVLYRQHRGD
jgi:hypothetical protein